MQLTYLHPLRWDMWRREYRGWKTSDPPEEGSESPSSRSSSNSRSSYNSTDSSESDNAIGGGILLGAVG